MKVIPATFLFFSFVFLSSTEVAHAQIPRTISYQGVLANADGTLIKDGNHSLKLTLYPTATGVTTLYTEEQIVPVVRGIFNVIIGTVTTLPFTLTFDHAYFLGVSVDGGSELSPRTALTAAPYALYAEHAGTADAVSASTKGVVTSVNEVDGSIRLVGAGATTVTLAGQIFTISSPIVNGGSALKLPYSDSAANGSKPIFNIGNTGANGNTISGIGANGSGITGMTTSAIFGDAGAGYNGVAGFSNGGSNLFAGVLGKAIGNANGIMAISANGDAVNATSSSARAGFFQTASTSNTLETVNSGSGEALKGSSVNTAIHGLSSSATGVLGETQSIAGIGVDARYSGTGIGTSLLLDNGAIKVGGSTRSVYVHTATAANIWGGYNGNSATEINNPLCNGDSTAMVFITHTAPASASLPTYASWWHIVYYDTTRQKWQIYEPGSPGIGVGDQFFVLIVKR